MTAIVFLVAGVLAYLRYSVEGPVIIDGLTVWIAWYLAVLASAGIFMLKFGDKVAKGCFATMLLFFVAGQWLWVIRAGYLGHAMLHVLTAGILAFAGNRVSQLTAATIMLGAVGVDFAGYNDLITSGALRPHQFIAWSYPDLLAAISHAATIVLASPFDGGSRHRIPARHPHGLGAVADRGMLHRSSDRRQMGDG